MKEKTNWQKIRKVLINKYAITLYLFALIFLFMGDHSFVQYVKRAKKVHEIEQQLNATNDEIKNAESIMSMLENVDSLEQFAREKHRMSAPNEDVYIIEE